MRWRQSSRSTGRFTARTSTTRTPWRSAGKLAVDVGELTRELVEVLTAAGWSEQQARNAKISSPGRRTSGER
jgi:hypothetical protein